jgi:acetolactate synthase-1/2/3 large subunit
MLRQAERPLADPRRRRRTAAGRGAIRDFLVGNDVPVAVSFRRQGLFDGTSPHFAGDLGVGADAGWWRWPSGPTSSWPSAPAWASR